MKSILENRPALAAEVDKVAETAGYLWQKGWAERNGGNITVNITEHVDDAIRAMEPHCPASRGAISSARVPTNVCATWRAARWRTAR